MWEHTALIVFLIICLILECVAIGFPDWAISTKTNQFDITSNIIVFVGFWQQCTQNPNHDYKNFERNLTFKHCFRHFVLCGSSIQITKSCRTYQVSQTALPPYFNYSRWMCCIDIAFTLIIIVLSMFTHPRLFNKSLPKQRKFWMNIFGVSVFMIITGLSGISAGAWFAYAAYANELGPLIGPGSETDRFQNVSFFTPYWACVLWLIVCCFLVVVGSVFGCRTCCVYGTENKDDDWTKNGFEKSHERQKYQNFDKKYEYETTSESTSYSTSRSLGYTNSSYESNKNSKRKRKFYRPPPSMPQDTEMFAYC